MLAAWRVGANYSTAMYLIRYAVFSYLRNCCFLTVNGSRNEKLLITEHFKIFPANCVSTVLRPSSLSN